MVKMLNRNNCTEIGFIKKTHGVKGELLVFFEDGLDSVIENSDYLYFEVEGLLVPFFIEEIEIRDNSSAAILFDTLDVKEKSMQYIGCKIFLDNDLLSGHTDILNPVLIKGFTVEDKKLGIIGEIIDINDFGGNYVLTVKNGRKEILIPFNDNLLVNFNEDKKRIIFDCPDGLLEIND
jgi:16S rRNA processing protein RimM